MKVHIEHDIGVDADAVRQYLVEFQSKLSKQLSQEDGEGEFTNDTWARDITTGGHTRVYRGGDLFESAGVNFSDVQGDSLPPSATANRPELVGCSYRAMGVSSVMHPQNPYIPTAHLNVRFFIASKPDTKPVWWFGGGFDLTPYYGFEDDAVSWHQHAHDACAPFGDDLYPRFKEWCDKYFYNKHRREARGVGGLFFDDFNELGFDKSFAFMRSVAERFWQAYCPIIRRRRKTVYGDRERQFQLYRRGRYVEYNLVYDRGTLFGLQSGGRTESILMSMPPMARWEYCFRPQPGSREERLTDHFLKPRDWISPK